MRDRSKLSHWYQVLLWYMQLGVMKVSKDMNVHRLPIAYSLVQISCRTRFQKLRNTASKRQGCVTCREPILWVTINFRRRPKNDPIVVSFFIFHGNFDWLMDSFLVRNMKVGSNHTGVSNRTHKSYWQLTVIFFLPSLKRTPINGNNGFIHWGLYTSFYQNVH